MPALQIKHGAHAAGVASPASPTCDLVIMDGSFLGGKDWIHKDTTLADKDNPAFNVYKHNSDAHQVGSALP